MQESETKSPFHQYVTGAVDFSPIFDLVWVFIIIWKTSYPVKHSWYSSDSGYLIHVMLEVLIYLLHDKLSRQPSLQNSSWPGFNWRAVTSHASTGAEKTEWEQSAHFKDSVPRIHESLLSKLPGRERKLNTKCTVWNRGVNSDRLIDRNRPLFYMIHPFFS